MSGIIIILEKANIVKHLVEFLRYFIFYQNNMVSTICFKSIINFKNELGTSDYKYICNYALLHYAEDNYGQKSS